MSYIMSSCFRMNTAGELEYIGPRMANNRRAQRCPVCNGRGWMPNGFYTVPPGINHFCDRNTGTETCRSCNGQGVI